MKDINSHELDELKAVLAITPERYNFFQLISLLERRILAHAPLGFLGPPDRERIRLRSASSLGFAASDVAALSSTDDAEILRIFVTVSFLGLYGASSPLPRWYSQTIDRLSVEVPAAGERPAVQHFLDDIHHRLLALLYRAWKQYHHEHLFQADGSDLLSKALLNLIGIEPDDKAEVLGIRPARLLRYLGLFLLRSRPLGGLQTLLTEELELPLKLEPAPLRCIDLAREQGSQLCAERRHRQTLGHGVALGTRRFDRATAIRVLIGPVEYATYRQLRPGNPLHQRLISLIRLYVRQPLDVWLTIQVPTIDIAQTQLGGCHSAPLGTPERLGIADEQFANFEFVSSLEHYYSTT